MWGVAAGDRFSIFLLDGAGFCPDIYYTGNQAGYHYVSSHLYL